MHTAVAIERGLQPALPVQDQPLQVQRAGEAARIRRRRLVERGGDDRLERRQCRDVIVLVEVGEGAVERGFVFRHEAITSLPPA